MLGDYTLSTRTIIKHMKEAGHKVEVGSTNKEVWAVRISLKSIDTTQGAADFARNQRFFHFFKLFVVFCR